MSIKSRFAPSTLRYWLPLLLGLLVIFPCYVTSDYVLNVAIMVGIYLILASSINITNGCAGIFSMGHAAFYGLGAYATGIMTDHFQTGFWLGLAAACATAVMFGLLVGVPTLRLKGIFFALVTVSFAEILRLATLNWIALTRGPMGIPGIPAPTVLGWTLTTNRHFYYLILIFDVIVVGMIALVIRSRVGRAWMAIREDDVTAAALGIPVFRYRLLALAFSSSFCGLAGCFYAHYATYLSADVFSVEETFMMLTMMIVGGMGTLAGPVVGAVLLVIFPEIFRFLMEYRMVAYGLILILMTLFRPSGLFGLDGIAGAAGWHAKLRRAPRSDSAV